jgi:DNA (cytosine-5)-methyltransferase 1
MAALIHRLQPRAFLFENVRGLLTARWNNGGENGDVWKQVLRTFRSLKGYNIAHKLIYAKDYGVPQNRPRVLMVGLRDDVRSPLLKDTDSEDGVHRGFLPAPNGKKGPDLISLLGDLIDDDYQNGGATPRYPRAARTTIQKQLRTTRDGRTDFGKGADVSEHDYSKHRPQVVEKFSAMIASGGPAPDAYKTKKFAQRVLRERWGPEGPRITATSLPDDYVHFSQPRILTVREWARLQMFPDWYQFSGSRSTGGIYRAGNPRLGVFHREVPKYTQIGNAVPVGLSQAVGEHLAKILR